MNSKILLLSIAVVSVGLFAMPSTLSLFAGQHTFDTGSNVSCKKCHQDIYDEMAGSGIYGAGSAHLTLTDCKGCHKTGNVTTNIPLKKQDGYGNFTYGNFNRTNLSGGHAAVTMECIGCHSGVDDELLNTSEAHGPFYNESINLSNPASSGILKGANEACVGCHTHTNIKGTWRRSTGYDMVVNETTTGNYSITFTVNQSVNVTHTFGGNVTNSS